jgi:hypothetical protein
LGRGVVQRETNAVEGDGVLGERLSAAIFVIAENGAIDGGELQADLVFATGEEVDLKERA